MSDPSPVPLAALHERIDQVRASNPGLSGLLRDISREIPPSKTSRDLNRLADAIDTDQSAAKIANGFPDLCWILTLNAGAATASALTETLSQAAYQTSLQNKKLRAILYPTAVLVVATGMTLVACATIVPIFDEMYQEFGIRLPVPTEYLMQLSRFVVAFPILAAAIVLLLAACLGTVIWLWIGESRMKQLLAGGTKAPSSMRHSLAKAAMQIAELADSGIETERVLRITAESNPDPTVRRSLGLLAMQARKDPNKMRDSRAVGHLPGNFAVALGAGESNAQPNPVLLRELASSYRDLSIERRDWSTFLIAQAALISVGFAIGYVVIALFAPMLSLVTGLS